MEVPPWLHYPIDLSNSPLNLPGSQSVPSPPHGTHTGKQKIQIKPTRGNWTQFYTFGWSIKDLSSYLMRTRKQADREAVGYHSEAGKGDHPWGRNQHWRRHTGSWALHLSPWIKPHLMPASSPRLKPVWVGFQLICHLTKGKKLWLMQRYKCL